MVVNDKTLKSFGRKWLIIYRESSPLELISHRLAGSLQITSPLQSL